MSSASPRAWFAKIGSAFRPAPKPTEQPPSLAVMEVACESSDSSLALLALVLANDTSVRLRNCIVAAADAGVLPFGSVRAYLAAGSMAMPTMMHDVRHLGAKSARELDQLVRAIGEVADDAVEIVAPADDGPSLKEIVEAIGHLSLAQAIEGELLSVRLENGLSAPDLQKMPFSAVVLAPDEFLAGLKRRPNVGRTSVTEMANLVRRVTPRLLTENGVAPDQVARACELLFGGKHVAEPDATFDEIPQFGTLPACLDWLLDQCEPRDRLIVERRFGLGQTPPETLEEIGSDYGVTRERIRQIEKRALTRMRVRMHRVPLADHVGAAAPGAWLHISECRGWIADRQVDQALRKLDGFVQLALELLETPSRTWLSTAATRAAHGWIGAPIDPELARSAAIDLDEFLKLPLPRSLVEAGGHEGSPHVEAAIRIELGLELDQGYVVQSKPGLRLRRALGLHRLLTSAAAPLSAERLIPLYHQLCPSDPCTARDADIVMQAAPHLFIETFDQVWFGIGACGAPPIPETRAPAIDAVVPLDRERDDVDDCETCAEALIAALERRGPERLLTLYQSAEDILPPGRSPNSVGPTLLSNPHLFVRLLPGVYGLHHQVPSPDDVLMNPPPYLLDNSQLRLLALARRAGERRAVFPLWSLEGEFALARWGRHHGSPENFRSLLAVADIDNWPTSPSERAHWQELARREGRFELADTPRQDAYVRPELDRLLAACIEAASNGALNWMAVNRMAGRRIDSHAAAAMMAILIALGALHGDSVDPSGWQEPHLAAERAADLRAQMLAEISSTGILMWDSGLGLRLQDELRANSPEVGGWPDAGRLAGMFERGTRARITPADIVIDPLDAIMADSRLSAETEKRENLLRWLLEE